MTTELDEALERLDNAYRDETLFYHEDALECIEQAARHWSELKRRIEAGEVKCVPFELTKQMKIDTGCMDNYDVDYGMDHACADQDHENWYKAALSAAPDIIADIEGEK